MNKCSERHMYRLSDTNSLIMDLIRIMASWFVCIGHAFYFFGVTRFDGGQDAFCFQNSGVVILFIISGFFITYSLFNKANEYEFKDYFIDRFSRISVAYVPALIFVAVIDFINISINAEEYIYIDAYNIRTFVGNILMLQDVPFFSEAFQITSFGSDRPLWTMSVEWWFYIAYGFIMLIVVKRIKRGIGIRLKDIISLLVLAIVPIDNLIGGRGNGLTFTWIAGCIVFVLFINTKSINKVIYSIFLFLNICALVLFIIIGCDPYTPIFTILIAGMIYLFMCIFRECQRKMLPKAIKFFAGYSYSLFFSTLSYIRDS